MKTMMRYGWVLAALLSFGAAALAQDFPSEPYDFLSAKLAAEEGRYDEALDKINAVIAKNPKDPVLLYERAIMQLIEIYQQENEWHKAAELLQPLIDEDPLNADLQRQQGFFYLRAGDARKAADRFKVLVGADPKDSRARYFLAEALNDLE